LYILTIGIIKHIASKDNLFLQIFTNYKGAMNMDFEARVDEYFMKGSCCAEALVRAGLDLLGTPNDQLASAVSALCQGIHVGWNCGALTGGALVLALFDRGLAATQMIPELTAWFDDTYGMEYGSVNCEDIAGQGQRYKALRCKPLTLAVGKKCMELLEENGLLPE
jgi:hypothetical protein